MKFNIFGVKVEISYVFVCFLTLFIGMDRSSLFLPVFFSVLLHELGHILPLFYFNCRIRELNLKIGTVGVVFDNNLTKLERIISQLSGPMSNLLLSGICLIFKNKQLWAINIILFIYNLLPVHYLDGGSIITTLLSGIVSEEKINIILSINTIILVFISLISFVFLYIKEIYNYSLLLFALYLILPLIIKNLLKDS